MTNLFEPNIFSVVKTVTGIFDLSKEKIVAILIRTHKELFEYYLKAQFNSVRSDSDK